jgi:hypothetical protein
MHNDIGHFIGSFELRRGGAYKMSAVWAVRDSNGDLLESLTGTSRLDVGCKIVPSRYDAFRLRVSSSYRELFDRALGQVLEQQRWEIVRVR